MTTKRKFSFGILAAAAVFLFGVYGHALAAVEISDHSVLALWHFNSPIPQQCLGEFSATSTCDATPSNVSSMGFSDNLHESLDFGAQAFASTTSGGSFIGFQGFTVGAWIVAPVSGGGDGMIIQDELGDFNLQVLSNNTIHCGIDGVGTSGNTAILAGSKHFIACVWDGFNFDIYIDGVLDSHNVFTGNFNFNGARKFDIGKNILNNNTQFNGAIDEVFLANKDEHSFFSAIYNSGLGDEICTAPGCATKEPVIIVPGIMGSYLNRASSGAEVWPDIGTMLTTGLLSGDSYLDDLQLSSGGVQIVGKEMHTPSVIEEVANTIFYKNLIHNLNGYTLGENLFVVPYDWRLDIPSQINKLDSVVSRAIASSTNGKINIIAHSMGGLLMRDYLAATSSSQFLDKLILLGTPNLGAPKAAKIINYGDDLDFKIHPLGFNISVLNADEIKKISQNMPAIYELLPSRNYFSTVGSYVANFGFGQANNFLNYEATSQFLINQGRNEGLLALADAYHTRDANPINASKIYNIVGCNNYNTIGGFLKYSDGRVDLDYISGDGTVPLGSANSISSTTLTYYAPFNLTGIDHMGLASSSDVINIVQSILSGNPILSSGNVSQDIAPCAYGQNRIIFQTHSPVSLSVYDSQNRHLGPTASGTIELGIPGAGYDIIEHNSFASVPAGDTYRVVLSGTASGTAEFDIESAAGATVTNKAVYQNIPIAGTQTVASTTFSGFEGDLTLNLDSDGNGATDLSLQPSAVLSGSQSADITPPTITMPNIASTTIVGTPLTFNFFATDDLSGVATTTATLDGIQISNNTTISNLAVGSHTLQVKAVDNAGNPAISSLSFNIVYQFGGFLPPIKTNGSGIYQQGRTLPVKFQLTDVNNQLISNAAAHLFVAKIQDSVVGTDEVALPTGNADSGNTFRYDSTDNQYIFNLDVGTLSAGTWQLKATLDDGTSHVVVISVKS